MIGSLFCVIQPIISFGFAMMKLNVRKYTTDLLTLSYLRKATELIPTSTSTAVDDGLEIAS